MQKLFIFKTFLFSLALFLPPAGVFAASAASGGKGQEITVTGPEHVTELWQGRALTAKFRVGMCFAPNGKARGVLLLRHANGNEDVYHLYGTMKDNEFNLSHSSGHFFSGRLTGPGTMEGKVKLSSGLRLNLKGERIMNAPLIAEDCAPLP